MADHHRVSADPVFFDPTGRRRRALRAVAFGLTATIVFVFGAFAIDVLNPPDLEPLPVAGRERPVAAIPDATTERCRGSACGEMPRPRRAGPPVRDPIVAGFLVQWDEGSRSALKRHAGQLDWVIVEGGFLGRGPDGAMAITLDRDLLSVARTAGSQVHLMLTNYGPTGFTAELVTALVGDAGRRADAVERVMDAVRSHQLDGITVDFELVPAEGHADVIAFLGLLRAALAPAGKTLSVAIPIGEGDGYPMARYAASVDYVIPMLYDQHASEDEPGPIASAQWFAERLDVVLESVPPSKVLAGLGQYGYHWRSGRLEGATVSVGEAMALARAVRGGPQFEATLRQPHARWRDASGVTHDVWYLDAATGWNHWKAAHEAGVAGAAIWRLGTEDQTWWRVLGRSGSNGRLEELLALPDNGVSVLSGEGEVLAVEGSIGHGARTIELDTEGFVRSEQVVRAAGGYLVSRGGTAPSKVAITFDDGPDPEFTTPILDTLRSRQAVASFFVVGKQVQRLPQLTRRIIEEGHEIGNHSWSHADFSALSDAAIRLELGTTSRVIEAVTGRHPLLVRPPYIGDARPATEDRLRPMAVATSMGYRVAGLEVDPKDWNTDDPTLIVARTLQALRRGSGRIILLHDAGGDRRSTVAALGPLVDSLRAAGFVLTTVAGLLEIPPTAGLAHAPAAEASQRALFSLGLRAANNAEQGLVWLFFVALVLGAVRLVGIGSLAALQRYRPRYARRAVDREWRPAISVLIPAFNEGRVIARTASSVLAQEYPNFEVVVIDDGSTDDTAAAARAIADPRFRVVSQPNAGKAAALNRGMSEAHGEVVVVIDADTLLAPDALRHLVRPLADRRVGAVAGNAKVGNRVNLVTRWQAVEYVTSQNLDRRAFVTLNCITVVPGAIGAWRRDAVLAAGGFSSDTLAEDQDLTLTLLRAGHRVALADQAVALTEAPESFSALLRQRFRWSFGTMQCAWKHRRALLHPSTGALGLVGLPNILLFQLLFPLLSPIADLALVAGLVRWIVEAQSLGAHLAWAHVAPVLGLYGIFLLVDTLTAFLGVAFEPGERLTQALLVPLKRLAYRQVLYLALFRAVHAALSGWSPGWGKLERTGRVSTAVG